jgi:hypothetical protein
MVEAAADLAVRALVVFGREAPDALLIVRVGRGEAAAHAPARGVVGGQLGPQLEGARVVAHEGVFRERPRVGSRRRRLAAEHGQQRTSQKHGAQPPRLAHATR